MSAYALSWIRISVSIFLQCSRIETGVFSFVARLMITINTQVAAGNTIFNVIVDNDHTAAKLMHMLERRKLGRVTFMPLNKLATRMTPRKELGNKVVAYLIEVGRLHYPRVSVFWDMLQKRARGGGGRTLEPNVVLLHGRLARLWLRVGVFSCLLYMIVNSVCYVYPFHSDVSWRCASW